MILAGENRVQSYTLYRSTRRSLAADSLLALGQQVPVPTAQRDKRGGIVSSYVKEA